jgi:glycosidase
MKWMTWLGDKTRITGERLKRALISLGFLGCITLSFFPGAAWAEASKGNLGNDILYYVVVDRFADGESGNNIPNYAFPLSENLSEPEKAYRELNQLLLRHSYDPTHRYIGLYWGGDLQGVINKLDYLSQLGVTQLILSPIQDNANGIVYYPASSGFLHFDPTDQENRDNIYAHASSSFHGYWTKDWFEIDEHFRNPADETSDRFRVMRQLLEEAAQRNMGVILDLTLNHTSPFPYYRYPPKFLPESIGFWFVDNGSVFRQGQRIVTYWDPSTGSLDPQHWFHPFLPIDFNRPTQEMVEKGTLPGGLPDLDQDNPEVESYLLDAAKFWLTFNSPGPCISGFRLDAVKHVNIAFWQKLENEVLKVNPNAILIGEYFSGGYRNKDSIQWLSGVKHYTQFDFNLSMTSRHFFARDRGWDGRTVMIRESNLGRKGKYYNYPWIQRLIHWILDPAETLEIPRYSLDAISDEDARGWVTFIGNHDEPRLLTSYPHMSQTAYSSLLKFLFVSRGVPMLMYGVETGLAVPYHPQHRGLFGIGGDPFNRQMMIWPGMEGWVDSYYQVTQTMAHLRQQHPVLRYGSVRFLFPRNCSPDNDLFMVREPSPGSSDPVKILYAYSTFGGEFLLSFPDDELQDFENVETGMHSPVVDNLIPIRLKPEESKVLILS